MTAKEAMTLSNKNKKGLKEVLFTVEAMAKEGERYATIGINNIRELLDVCAELKSLGYELDVTPEYLTIKW